MVSQKELKVEISGELIVEMRHAILMTVELGSVDQ